jgi:hypothetical protein
MFGRFGWTCACAGTPAENNAAWRPAITAIEVLDTGFAVTGILPIRPTVGSNTVDCGIGAVVAGFFLQ